MTQRIGPRELALRAQTEARYTQQQKENTMRKTATATKAKIAAQALQKVTSAPRTKRASKSRKKAAGARAAKSADPLPRKTKIEQLTDFLRTPGGVTCAQIEKKFGWLPHSARAAVSKVPKVRAAKEGGITIYTLTAA